MSAPEGSDTARADPLLDSALNLSRFHREHERFYASSPLETALRLQRHARTLQALADRWTTVGPAGHRAMSPYAGAEDLNSEAATALDGVLFLEGGGRPAELTAMITDLRASADGFTRGGEWLVTAMQTSWDVAQSLLRYDGLAEVMGERHRIITNDWLSGHMQTLVGSLLSRAADMLDQVGLTPAELRADLAGERVAARRLHATAELISRAADLCCESAQLVHDNERRWRLTQRRIEQLLETTTTDAAAEPAHPR
jgi:hypothetical protein